VATPSEPRAPGPPVAGEAAAAAAPAPAGRFTARRRVEFADTDLGGIVHFSRFFVFMETTEHLFLESLGLSVHQRSDGRVISWPRVAASCEYLAPARFGDLLDVHLAVARKGRRSLAYGFEFRRGGELLARGRTAAVCCALDGAGGLEAIPIPAAFAARIAEAADE
jgi:YbgC/YbaW family acyl-CoA thioester hydrolase